ncbi:cysteine peptidase family C39 domain-containing protein [Apibacter raozihei]|uniref:cysteine peptidase family C39 domain-containing protein n=1 Tax=Apibacter raozihei TaxID=2500547 RepID=UPI0013E3ABA8|nr:cysteine peptidase family C39 domain-containing protein [Apibacter raozihei]
MEYIPKAIENLGLDINTTSGKVSYEQLKTGLENGNSAVVSVNDGQGAHSVIIDRIENGQVTVRDPLPIGEGSSYTIPTSEFETAWGRFNGQGKVVIITNK